MAVPRSRIQDLIRTQCQIYSTTHNPTNTRTGSWVLRQRLKGPAVASYYPPRPITMRKLRAAFPGMETFDEKESDRVDDLAITKARGKGPPKKKRTKEEGRKGGKGGKKR